ncbi:MAG: hypothetical protein RL735_1078 [Pseudomonadota bacterium]
MSVFSRRRGWASLIAAGLAIAGGAHASHAAPSLVADLVTGHVISHEDGTRPWYPASLTKLMTGYVALKAVREGRVTMDTPFVMSARAARVAPSKMGFNPGTEVTLDNALKMLMVKSANDIAIMIAEGISGSVEGFSAEMNAAARQIGMRQSHFLNPHGLHEANHVSSARDMAMLARALHMQFPERADLYGIGALKLGDRIMPTHNGLIGRYPGADGMKTGFVCASGFNVVASAIRGGRQIVVVVMGSPNARSRTIKAANLFDAGFASSSFFRPTSLAAMADQPGPPPNMREDICGKNRSRVVQEDDLAVMTPQQGGEDNAAAFFANDGRASGRQFVMGPRPNFEPIDVFIGRKSGWTGPVAQAMPAAVVVAGAAGAAARSLTSSQPSIGTTASRAIAVKSTSDKKPEQKMASSKPTQKKTAVKTKKPEQKKSVKKPEKKKVPAKPATQNKVKTQ